LSKVETDRYHFFETDLKSNIGSQYYLASLIIAKFEFAYRPILKNVKYTPIISVSRYIGRSLVQSILYSIIFSAHKSGLKRPLAELAHFWGPNQTEPNQYQLFSLPPKKLDLPTISFSFNIRPVKVNQRRN